MVQINLKQLWSSINILSSLGSPARIRVNEFVKQHATDALTLDLGCGTSRYSELFPNRVAVDIDYHYNPINVCADAHRCPFRDGTFEVVICTELLEHVCEPQIVIAELYRVLKEGGKCIITTRFCYPLHDAPQDFYRYSRHGLQHLFREWKIEELQEDTGGFSAIGILIQYNLNMGGGRLFKKALKIVWAIIWGIYKRLFIIKLWYGILRTDTRMPSGYCMVVRKSSYTM